MTGLYVGVLSSKKLNQHIKIDEGTNTVNGLVLIEAETLSLLEWQRLGEHLATFTSTKLGARVARNLPIPDHRETSLTLLTETKEVYQLEANLTTGWKFEGIYDFGSALERAEYKGILTGETLLQIATTLVAMRRLRRVIDGLEASPRLKALISQVRTYPELEKEINRCLDDKGKVTERASPKLAEIRQKIKERRDRIYQKLQNIIQQQGGAIQEPVITQRNDRFAVLSMIALALEQPFILNRIRLWNWETNSANISVKNNGKKSAFYKC